MSAAKDYLNRKWVDWIVALVISLIAVFTTFNLELFGDLATKEYVNDKVEGVRREHQIEMNSVMQLLERIDKRAERIEDRLNK